MTGDPNKQEPDLDLGIDMTPGEKDMNMDVTSPPPYINNHNNTPLTHNDFTNSEHKELIEKDIWFVVPVHHYNLYKNIAKGNNNLQPVQLDCSCLLEKNHLDGKFLLKRNIQENIDYTLCSSELFCKIDAQYGVADEERDVIKREVIKEGKYRTQLAIELHLLILQTSEFRAYDEATSKYKPPSNKIKMGPSSAVVETTQTITFEISTASTLRDLRQKISQIYEIENNNDFDLYLRFEQIQKSSSQVSPQNSPIHSEVPKYTPLDQTVDKDSVLQTDLGLIDNNVIVIDKRNTNFRAKTTIYGKMDNSDSDSKKKNTNDINFSRVQP